MVRFDVEMDEDRSPGPAVTITPVFVDDGPVVPAWLRLRPPDADDGVDEEGADAPDGDAHDTERPRAPASSVAAARVEISVERLIPGFDGLPFSYEIAEPTGRSVYGDPLIASAIVRIVAAPGVNVRLFAEPRSGPIARVDVIRVQDPHCVPPLGEPIDASLLLMTNGVPMHRNSLSAFLSPQFEPYSAAWMTRMRGGHARRERVQDEVVDAIVEMRSWRIVAIPQRDGMLFFDNATERMLHVRVRTSTRRDLDVSTGHRARFGYVIEQAAAADDSAVIVVATPGVEVAEFSYTAAEAGDSMAPPVDPLLEARASMRPFMLVRTSDFDDVPLPGQRTLESARGLDWMRDIGAEVTVGGIRRRDGSFVEVELIPRIEPPPDLDVVLQRLATDTLMGLLPGVGDALDLVEFVGALGSGRDRWGERVGHVEIALMGVGVALPFVNSTLVRRVGHAAMLAYIGHAGWELSEALGESPEPEGAPE